MKAYDYGFLSAIVATLLATVGGIAWLSMKVEPARQALALSVGTPLGESEREPTAQPPSPQVPQRTVSTLPVGAAMRVRGVVTGPDGAGLAGVRVRPDGDLAPETLTGPHGSYELLLPLDPVYSHPALRFLADGYEDQHAVLEAPLPVAELDVLLEPRRERTVVSGRVTARGGEAVPGELVEIESERLGAIHTARTDARGRFVIGEVPVADDYELRIRPDGPYQQLWQFPLRATRDGLDLDLVLEPMPDDTHSAASLQVSAKRPEGLEDRLRIPGARP